MLEINDSLAIIDDKSTGIKVSTLTSDPIKQHPALVGMSLAKFSRSSDTYADNLASLIGKDYSHRLENIAVGYGHTSVSGMAHTNMIVEEVSILDHINFFYNNPLVDGQARSTRYQDYSSDVRFIAVPSIYGTTSLRNTYKAIIKKQMADYKEMYSPTRSFLSNKFNLLDAKVNPALHTRTLDCLRYFIPLALKDSFGAVTSARTIASYIGQLKTSGDPISNRLGDLLTTLYTQEVNSPEGELLYKPEISFLIKHVVEDPKYYDLSPLVNNILATVESPLSYLDKEDKHHAYLTLPFDSLTKLAFPLSLEPVHELDEEAIARFLSMYDNHLEMPYIFSEGMFTVASMTDIGTIKDIVRHRSLSKCVPLLHKECNLDAELDRPSFEDYFSIPEYIKDTELEKEYTTRLTSTYQMIMDWYDEAVDTDIPAQYTKRLLPHAHLTQISIGGSYKEFSYMAKLRTKPSGHIGYRSYAYDVVKALTNVSPCFDVLLSELTEVDVSSVDDFVSRI